MSDEPQSVETWLRKFEPKCP